MMCVSWWLVVSRSQSGELRVLCGGQHSAYQTRNHLVEKRWLSLWVGTDFALLDRGYVGGSMDFGVSRLLPFNHRA